MGYARSHTVPADISGIYHCYSRCVRRERLLESLDRVALLERRLAFLSTRVFAVDLIEFKPMGNHLHLIVRVHPELAWCWTDEEVARRWLTLSLAGRRPDLEDIEGPSDAAVAALVEDKPRIEELRRRLSNLGAYHAAWREWTAKRWNREDRVSGHFWQGRYGVTTALDDAAVLTQSTYVLLNAVHAGLEQELGTQTGGSLATRMKRLIKKAAHAARELIGSSVGPNPGVNAGGGVQAEAFEREFVHASWTPVYPCDPGSAADLDDKAFAERVAAGKHQASHRASLREDGLALAHFATRGEREDVERVAWELRDPGRVSDGVSDGEADGVKQGASDGASHGESLPSESEPQRRPRPMNAPRHRRQPFPARTAARRTVLKPDEQAWLTPMANVFHASRLVDGAVPVIPGMTLGMLIDFVDEEGRHPRPDKRGSIARGAERAIVSLRREFLIESDGAQGTEQREGRSDDDLARAAAADPDAATLPVIAVARKLTASVRSGIAKLVSSVMPSVPSEAHASGQNGSAKEPHQPIAMTPRGSAFGTRESLAAEAARRGGTSVHAVRMQLTSCA